MEGVKVLKLFPAPLVGTFHAVQIVPPPSAVATPIELRLSHAKEEFEAVQQQRDLGKFTLDLDRVRLPGLPLDVNINEINLNEVAKDVTLSLGRLGLNVTFVSRQAQADPEFTTSLAEPAAISADTITTREKPQAGIVVEIDTGTLAEVRTIDKVEGSGPFTSSLSDSLAFAHLVNVPVTQRKPVSADALDPAEAAVPITEPFGLGARLRGALGSVTGAIQHLSEAGSLGSIRGIIGPKKRAATVDVPALDQEEVGQVVASIVQTVLAEGVTPSIKVCWSVTDGRDQELRIFTPTDAPHGGILAKPGTPSLALTGGALTGTLGETEPPTIVLLPEFVSLDESATSVRKISCTLTLTADGYKEESRKLGPITLDIPSVALPTVAVMTEHITTDQRDPGAILVLAPLASPSWRDWRVLNRHLATARHLLEPLLGLPEWISARFSELDSVLRHVVQLLETQPTPVSFYTQNEIVNLYWETRAPGWPSNWQDVISSVALVGAPETELVLYNQPDLRSDEGAFRVVLGPLPAARVDTLRFRSSSSSGREDAATVIPSTSKVLVDVAPVSGWPSNDPIQFNDIISSVQFRIP